MAVNVRKLSRSLGAEVLGVNLRQPITPALRDDLRQAFLDYQVLLFRDQDITPEQHIELTRIFGEPDQNASVPDYRHPNYPEILLLTNERREGQESKTGQVGRQWHSDHSMTDHPTLGSLLHAQEVPDVGGDTMFTNMYAAYDALSPGMQAVLDPLLAIHDVTKARHLAGRDPDYLAAKRRLTPPVTQPVVRVHPDTGRKALYVSEMMTTTFVGMTEKESAPILDYLYAHSIRPEFTYRHQWRRHDLLMWDNRCTMHLALGDFDPQQTRRMYRTALVGTPCGQVLDTPMQLAAE